MIKITIIKEKEKIKEVTLSGHSFYSEKGYDIVCSAISSIVVTTVNGILSLKETIKTKDDGKTLDIRVLENDEVTEKLLENMIKLFQGIEAQFKENVKIILKGE